MKRYLPYDSKGCETLPSVCQEIPKCPYGTALNCYTKDSIVLKAEVRQKKQVHHQ